MKILMVLEVDFPPDIRVENEVTSLTDAGHEVIMACYSKKHPEAITHWRGCKIYKRQISEFTYKSSVGALRVPFYFHFWRKFLEEIIRSEKPDAIHIHDLPLAKLGLELKERFAIPFILDLHENWPALLVLSEHTRSFLGRLLSSNAQWVRYEKRMCDDADRVIVVIEEAKERLSSLGIDPQKIHIVANYPVLDYFNSLQGKKEGQGKELILFYAGGISLHRGLQYIIGAIPEIIKEIPGMKLWILGDGRYRKELDRRINELKIWEHVEFFGQVPYKTVLEKLALADIALIPHVRSPHTDNTIPHKLFQYMYAGIPVISSDCAPIERILRKTAAGWVYPWNSSDAFADLVRSFKELRKEYDPERVRKIVEKEYSWEKAGKNLLQLYEGLSTESED